MSLRRSVRISKSVSIIPIQQASQIATTQVSRKRKADVVDPGKPSKRSKKIVAVADNSTSVQKPDSSDGPVTPARAKSTAHLKAVAFKTVPLKPTPSLVKTLQAPYSTGDIDDATPPAERLADPYVTNATLVTPGGTKATALPSHARLYQPSNLSPSKRPTTTNTLLEKAQAHLISVDSRFEQLISKHRCAIFSPEGLHEEIDPFRSLVSGICGQQVSGAAARSIKNKFVALFNEENAGVHVWPSPRIVAKTSIERLRTAGLSQRKAEYIQGLAEKFVSGELSTEMLLRASDEEIMEKLIAVRGLGKWSVEMFACFGLKRMDILSTGDLGVQKGMAAWFGKDVAKLKSKGGGKWKYMSEADMIAKSEEYAPYRSLFMWYMWRVADVDIAVLKT